MSRPSMDWQDRGVCVTATPRPDPDLFSPSPPTIAALKSARQFCNRCPVGAQCGVFAAQTGQSGIWGGDYYENGRPKEVTLRPPLTSQTAERKLHGSRSGCAKANQHRYTTAAERVCESLARAYSLLTEAEELTPARAEVLRLRLAYRDAPLAELAKLASPPLTKDALSSRLRYVVRLADHLTAERGLA
jgi:hypothetical protein